MMTTFYIVPLASASFSPPLLLSGGVWDIITRTSFFGGIILSVLLIMSLVSWGIIIHKYRQFKEVNAQTAKFAGAFSRSRELSELLNQVKSYRLTPLAAIYASGLREADLLYEAKNKNSQSPETRLRLDEQDFGGINHMLDKAVSEELGRLERNVVFLATTANAAPFLGLLGTVVGVMDSFWSIGERGSASLTIVAPGIAEALLATIVGLAAAIPAVIGYNWANNKLKYISEQSNNFSLELLARLKRDSYR